MNVATTLLSRGIALAALGLFIVFAYVPHAYACSPYNLTMSILKTMFLLRNIMIFVRLFLSRPSRLSLAYPSLRPYAIHKQDGSRRSRALSLRAWPLRVTGSSLCPRRPSKHPLRARPPPQGVPQRRLLLAPAGQRCRDGGQPSLAAERGRGATTLQFPGSPGGRPRGLPKAMLAHRGRSRLRRCLGTGMIPRSRGEKPCADTHRRPQAPACFHLQPSAQISAQFLAPLARTTALFPTCAGKWESLLLAQEQAPRTSGALRPPRAPSQLQGEAAATFCRMSLRRRNGCTTHASRTSVCSALCPLRSP